MIQYLKNQKSFYNNLIINFLLSTILPTILLISLIMSFHFSVYLTDIKKLNQNTLNVLSQNIYNYLYELEHLTLVPSYNEEFFYLFNNSKVSLDAIHKIQLERSLDHLISFVRYTRRDIVGSLIIVDGESIYFNTPLHSSSFLSYDFSTESWYDEVLSSKGRAHFLAPHSPIYYTTSQEVFSIVRAIINIKTREPLGIMKIDINTDFFNDLINDLNFHVPSQIIITDTFNNVIFSETELSEDLILQLNSSNSSDIFVDNINWTVNSNTLPRYNWKVHILLSSTHLKSKQAIIYIGCTLLYALCIFLAFIFYRFLSSKLVSSINALKTTISEIQQGNFSARYIPTTNDELSILGEAINDMSKELKEHIDQAYILELAQKNSQYMALQAQIQPHFLFNTLNNFIALNQIGATQELEDSIYNLTNMLRYILDSNQLSTLQSELNFIDNYISLQKIRFRNKLNYSLMCDPSFYSVEIPKLLIQPLIENAIIHGIEPISKSCTITITVENIGDPDFIRININDNGIGFDSDNTPFNIGLKNIEERITLLHPDNQFMISSIPHQGTTATIILYVHKGVINCEHFNC